MKRQPFLRLSMFQLRRIMQVLVLVIFGYLFAFTTFMNPQPELAGLFLRLDPLVAITAMLAGRAFIVGMALSGLTILLSLVFGRAWCGWLCPMGTILDFFSPKRTHKNQPRPPSDRWRLVKFGLLFFLLCASVFGSQTFIFLDPITLLTRTLTSAIWPALGFGVAQVEAFFYQFEFLWPGLDAFHSSVIFPVFKDIHPVFWMAIPTFLFFAGIVAANWIAERFWCRYLCPLGGMLGLISRISLFRRWVSPEKCTACSACSRHCAMGTIRPDQGFTSDPAECTQCFECVDTCPKDSTTIRAFLPGWKPASGQPYDLKRREVLGLLGAALGWAALAGVEPIRARQPAALIRPPGTKEADFEAACIRCSECIRVCPTQGLQPGGLEGGWQNLLTPRLEPRLGACSYNCSACGQVCPSGAIPKLSLIDKRHQPIGLARVDSSRCLPWAYNIACIVCEESCPLPKKAIRLEEVIVANALGEKVNIQRPYIIKELCIGCGMCEHQCPMGGDAAIRVFAYSTPGGYLGDKS